MSIPQPSLLLVQAETGTYATDLANATWRDSQGLNVDRTDYTKAPFYIEDNGHTLLFSAGCYPDSTVPRLGSHNAASYAYHDFDHASLVQFRGLTNNKNAAVIVLTTPLLGAAVTSLTFSWSSTSGGAQDVNYLYSYDGGHHWNIAETGTTESKTSIQFNETVVGNHVQVGVLLTYSAVAYRYINNPNLSIDQRTLTNQERAEALMDLVASYTPCLTDDQGLLLADENVANNLKNQYDALPLEAQTIFDAGMIDAITSHRERLRFILGYHQIELMTNHAVFQKSLDAYEYVFILIAMVGVLGYAASKRKDQNK